MLTILRILVVVLLAGCGDEPPAPPEQCSVANLTGTYIATGTITAPDCGVTVSPGETYTKTLVLDDGVEVCPATDARGCAVTCTTTEHNWDQPTCTLTRTHVRATECTEGTWAGWRDWYRETLSILADESGSTLTGTREFVELHEDGTPKCDFAAEANVQAERQ